MNKMIILDVEKRKEMSFEEILEMYRPLLRSIIYSFRSMNLEFDDMYQEGSVALWNAYVAYDINIGIGFWVFAKKSIQNKFKEISNTNNRQKRKCLVHIEPLVDDSDDKQSILDTLQSDANVEMDLVIKELFNDFVSKITLQQKETIALFATGKKYKEIAVILGVSPNAISMRMTAARNIFNNLRRV